MGGESFAQQAAQNAPDVPYTENQMALPPTIPTSFVPRPGAASIKRHADLSGAFGFFAYGVLGIAIFLAVGAFIYSSILTAEQKARDDALAKAVTNIDSSTVESFVHLRDRLSSGKKLLDAHPAVSNLFGAVSAILPTTVRFSNLHLKTGDTGAVTIEVSGMAKSFNALAAASDAFAADGRIKDAIFSDIKVQGNAVTFTLAATLAPTLIAFSPSGAAAAQATSTATTTAP